MQSTRECENGFKKEAVGVSAGEERFTDSRIPERPIDELPSYPVAELPRRVGMRPPALF